MSSMQQPKQEPPPPPGYSNATPNTSSVTPNRQNNNYMQQGNAPLLDQDQTAQLENFFDNPNHALDPQFQPAQQTNYQQDTSSYGDTSGLDWLRNMATTAQQQKLAAESRPISQQQNGSRQRQPSYGNPTAPQANMTASADDYAAAQLLLGNQEGRYNDPNQYAMQGLNGYNYPDVGSNSNANPYSFAGQNGIYGMPQSRYPDGSSRQLNFGTDDQFRSSYAGGGLGPSEQNALQQLSALAEQHISANAAMEASAKSLKRGRGEDGDGAEDDDTNGVNKRLKVDEDDDYQDAAAKGKRRQSNKGVAPVKKKSPGLGGKSARENLSEEQKRNNHIQSEQKRRNLIRAGFDELNKLVPELRAGGFSKSNSLSEACKFVKKLQEDNDELKLHLKAFENG